VLLCAPPFLRQQKKNRERVFFSHANKKMLKRALSYTHAAVWRRSHSLSTAAAPAAVEPLEGSYVWFPGHMARALRIMKAQMRTVNMIVEVRDARIPRSGINPVFEELVAARRDGTLQRIVVYNKIDLAGGSISVSLHCSFLAQAPP
jgi:hypothetical protein